MQKNTIVILTREREDNAPLLERLGRLDIDTLEYPCIQTEIFPYQGDPIDGMALEQFDAMAFSSRRGVRGMMPVAGRVRRSRCVLAAVGKTTALAIEKITGRKADLIARPQTGEGMARSLMEKLSSGGRVLHVRGSKTTGTFKKTMGDAGFRIHDLIVYENREPDLEPIKFESPPVVIFASPSAAKAFYRVNPDIQDIATHIAIGQTTADYLKNLNIPNIHVARRPSDDGILACITEILNSDS
jgi:uroporphyrinogen-III synthase